jgi:short-subunit dehydrogenase
MNDVITSWDGQRVLVTGASSGIGAAIAREFAGLGATVGLCARRTELLTGVLDDCRKTSPSSEAWTVDLSELEGLSRFIRRVEDAFGGIDVLVNNAGVSVGGEAMATSLATLEAQLRINYLSPVQLTLSALPAMQARGSGHVVVVSSMAARTSTPGEAAYAAAKSALTAYFEALAGELWDGPVRFHLVYPALIDLTPGVDGDDELAESSTGATPIPAAVMARAVRRQLERGDLELYVPRTMGPFVARRGRDVPKAIEFMARLHREGTLH